MTNKELNQQVYLGYFASLLPALFLAVTCADMTIRIMTDILSMTPSAHLQPRLSAAVFAGLCLANPVSVWLHDSSAKLLALRALAGMAIGALAYDFVLFPLLGDGVLRFALLLIGAMGVPFLVMYDFFAAKRANTRLDAAEACRDQADRVAQWPGRLTLFAIAAVTGCGLWVVAPTVELTVLGFCLVMVLLTLSVVMRMSPQVQQDCEVDDDMTALFDAIPAPVECATVDELADKEFKALVISYLPAAVFLGATITLAMRVALAMAPAIAHVAKVHEGSLETTAVAALLGLVMLVIGGAVSLGLALVALRFVGHYRNWQTDQVDTARARLFNMLSLQPIHRSKA